MTKHGIQPEVEKIAGNCIAARLRRVNRLVNRIYDAALRPHGIKIGQVNILVVAASLGTVPPGEVVEILEMEVSTLSRNLARMRARGWIEDVAGEDARSRPFRLTRSGRKLLKELAPAWETAQKRAAELLGRDGVKWLGKVSGALGPMQQTS